MMKGANFSPPCPMLAIAMSLRANSTMDSIMDGTPRGGWPAARCFWRARPVRNMVSQTRNAATIMKTTCLVGDMSMATLPTWMGAQRGRSIRKNSPPNGESNAISCASEV